MSVVVAMGKFTPVQTEYAIKDHISRSTKSINAHIIVGTPGTMLDLIRRKVLDLSHVKVLVLDEADDMLDQDGLGDQTLRVKKCVADQRFAMTLVDNVILSFSCSSLPNEKGKLQILLFSATFADHVRRYADKIAPNANKIELQKNELSVDNIHQFYMHCKNEDQKYDVLVLLYNVLTIGQSIIFCEVRGP